MSSRWERLRIKVFKLYDPQCMCCKRWKLDLDDQMLCVDHIKPKSKYPELAYDINNLQILCRSCNSRKKDYYIMDYRHEENIEDSDSSEKEQDSRPIGGFFSCFEAAQSFLIKQGIIPEKLE